MKRKRLRLRKRRFLLLIVLVLIVFSSFKRFDFQKTKTTNNHISILQEEDNSFEEEIISNTFAFLEIPKINLNQELFPLESKENDVDKNLFLVNNSVFPKENSTSNVIIAGHSGNSKISYFKNLYKLALNDELYFFYQGRKYIYKVKKIEYQDKTGTLFLKNDFLNMLTLITCTNNDNKMQTIYYAEQEKV